MENRSSFSSSPNERLGSPVFLLRPPDMSASSRQASVVADGASPSPGPSEGMRRTRGRLRPRLESEPLTTPTRHASQRVSNGSWRPPWTPPGTAQPPNGLPPLGRLPAQDEVPSHRREPESRWITNGSYQSRPSGGGASSIGGWGSSGGGGHQAGTSLGGGSASTSNGGRQVHENFNATLKQPDHGTRTPQSLNNIPEGSYNASPSPVSSTMMQYPPHSGESPSNMPEYLKVFTVPKDVRYEEDVVIEPIIQSLGVGDKQMEERITEQMSNLHDFFRRLYDQDQEEIRCLQAQMEQRDMEIRRLRRLKVAVNKDDQTPRSPDSPDKQKRRHLDQAAGLKHQSTSPLRGPPQKPLVALVVPPVAHPVRPFYKWWVNVQDVYRRHSTLILGILFFLLLILAIGLLAGLLSTKKSADRSWTALSAPFLDPGPSLSALWSSGLAFSVNMSQGASTFYALVPAAALTASKYKPSVADVRALMQGPYVPPLESMAVACGERTAMNTTDFTFVLAGSTGWPAEAVNMTATCGVPGALPGKCSLCPDIHPESSYTLLVTFTDSEELFQLSVTTTAAPESNGTAASNNYPSPASPPSPPPPPPSLLPPSPPPPSPPPPSPPLPSPPPLLPGELPIPVAPDFTVAPSAAATGQTSAQISFALSGPGVVRYLLMHPVVYAQAGGQFVSYASTDPTSVHILEMAPAPNSNVAGVGGAVAAGSVVVTQTEQLYRVQVDGFLPGSVNAAAYCACGDAICNCTAPAPCLGDLCNVGPSGLTPSTTYKVFISVSSPDGFGATKGPFFAGTITTAADTTAPALSPSATVAPGTITPNSMSLDGIQLATSGIAYVLVTRPMSGEQSMAAGTASSFVEQGTGLARRRLAALQHGNALEGVRSSRSAQLMAATSGLAGHVSRTFGRFRGGARRGLLQQSSNSSLVALDPAPAAQVFTPSCPRTVECDIPAVLAAYMNASAEALAAAQCLVLANPRDGALPVPLKNLSNDTTYIVRVVTEDVLRNRRVYQAAVRTVDKRPPSITSVTIQSAFTAFNLSVTLSEPGAVMGFLYTAAGASNLTLTASSWPLAPQGPVIEQASAFHSTSGGDVALASATTYILPFTDSSITPNTNYTVALVARDLPGNVQPVVMMVKVRTDDNVPPVWLASSVTPSAYNASVTVQLDEAASVFWFSFTGNVSCPTAAQLFAVADGQSNDLAGLFSRGQFDAESGLDAMNMIVGLSDGTIYTLCLVAEDAARLPNRQIEVQRLEYVTQDRTPPNLTTSVMRGLDGNFTCDRTTFRCRLSLNVSLSEAGTVYLALQYADPRVVNFTAAYLTSLNMTAPPTAILVSSPLNFTSAGSLDINLHTLASGRAYSVDLAAVDTSGNLQAAMVSLTLVAPDVTPPIFSRYSAISTADTFITVSVSVNEPCNISWVVMSSGSAAPNVTEVLSAGRSGGMQAGVVAYAPNMTQAPLNWTVGGLVVAQLYDVYLVARDVSGNQQMTVSSITRVRVQDSTPPRILSLTTSLAATGNRLKITINSTKVGALRYMAVRAGAPTPTVQQLLQPATYTGSANFTGQFAVTSALSPVSAVLCVADGASFQIFAVQEDTEGTFPNRLPNYSNVTRSVQLPITNVSTTCSPEARMQSLQLGTALASGSLGWPVGRLTSIGSAQANATWVRDYILVGGLGGDVGLGGTVVASMEGLQLGSFNFRPTRPAPAQIRVALQTPTLYQELPAAAVDVGGPADPSVVLRFAYQMLDSLQRPTGSDDLRIVPSLMSSVGTRFVMPDCGTMPVSLSANVSQAMTLAGAGLCRVEVPAQAFPVAGGAANYTLQADVFNGTTLVVRSPPSQVTLRTAAVTSYAVPSNGMLILSLPSRPVRTGETFRVTISAAVGSLQTITGFTVQLLFNASRLAYVSSDQSDLWADLSPPSIFGTGVPNIMQLGLTSITRAASNFMYQNRTVPLVDAFFKLLDNVGVDGTELTILSVGASTALHPASGAPSTLAQNYRNSNTSSILLASPRQLSLFAYMANHDIFNTAGLDGNDVNTPVQALVVSDWAASTSIDNTVTSADLSRCTCTPATNVSRSFAVSNCHLSLTTSHTWPIKQALLSVACGTSTAVQAQTLVNVWYPLSFRAETSDPDSTLSSLLPVNVPAPAAGTCQDRYQSAQLYLLATWSNGGSSASDTLMDVDVTRLAAGWTSDAPLSLRVSGSTATGVIASTEVSVSALSASGRVLASIPLAVSDEPVCVESVEAVALSGVRMIGEAAPTSLGRWRVRFTPQQALDWERASAKVSVFATLSDNTTMPVSSASMTTAAPIVGVANSALPFGLQPLAGYPSLDLQSNFSFGSPPACGDYLRSSWRICSSSGSGGLLLATGTGMVRVALPTPTGISSVLPSSASIASSGSGADLPPISVPTRSALQVLVAFDDGLQRDLSTDRRVQVAVAEGSDLCRVVRDAITNQPYVEAIGTTWAGGTCKLEARAGFANLPALVGSNTTTVVALKELQVYVTDDTPARPPTTDSSSETNLASSTIPLRLLKCDFSHYRPASVWVMGKLSDCGDSCDLVDLNNQTYTKLVLSDKTAVDLVVNPSNSTLVNVLQPSRPGQSILKVTFAGRSPQTYTVNVEDTFQSGWPRVISITDNGFTIVANMTSASFTVMYLVRLAADVQLSLPTAADVQRAGVALRAPSPNSSGPFFLSETLTTLVPATNYTVFLAVKSASKLVGTVVAITGVLTTDYAPPTFSTIGTPQGLTVDSQRFTFRLPLTLSEAGTINYAVYRNSSCISGGDTVPVDTIVKAARLPSTVCGCSDTMACQAVASGNITLAGSQFNDTITISGLLPPNPYVVLSGASQDQLTCRTAPLPAPVTATHSLYLVAQDDLPTYKDWTITCTPPTSSPGSGCDATAFAPCTALPGPGGKNPQALPYMKTQLGQQTPVVAGAPILASFSLPVGDNVTFDAAVTNITFASRTISFIFKVNKVSAVQYRLDQFNGSSVFSGVFPVFDPAVPYNVAISKTCSGSLLTETSYTLWYWSTDVYGRSSDAISKSIVFT